jgi:hypothetical protein
MLQHAAQLENHFFNSEWKKCKTPRKRMRWPLVEKRKL